MFELLNTLYVQAQGASLGLDHDTVRVRIDGEETSRFPLSRIESIAVFGNVSITPFLIHRCGEDGRPISWLTRAGRFRARLTSPARGNVLLRRQQHEALNLSEWIVRIARQVVAGKLQNSRLVLLRAGREASGEAAIALGAAAVRVGSALKQLAHATYLDEIRGIEGEGARAYFGVFGHMVRSGESAGQPFDRSRRPPRDGANALLSFLYALLREECVAGLESVGLDPQVGYLHTLRPGQALLTAQGIPGVQSDVRERDRARFDVGSGQRAVADVGSRQRAVLDIGARDQRSRAGRTTKRDRDRSHAQREPNGQPVAADVVPSLHASPLAVDQFLDLPLGVRCTCVLRRHCCPKATSFHRGRNCRKVRESREHPFRRSRPRGGRRRDVVYAFGTRIAGRVSRVPGRSGA